MNLIRIGIFLGEYSNVGELKRCWDIQGNDYKAVEKEISVKSKVRKWRLRHNREMVWSITDSSMIKDMLELFTRVGSQNKRVTCLQLTIVERIQ